MSDSLSRLGQIYDANAPKIFRYIYHRLGDAMLAEDLTSEVFVRFLHVRAEPDNTTAFLYRMAHNLVIDYLRQHQPFPLLDDVVCADRDDPAIAAELESDRALVRRALALLTPDQQQVIVLKFLEGLSNEQIARVLDKPIGAVKALQHRGLATLRDLLAQSRRRTSLEKVDSAK